MIIFNIFFFAYSNLILTTTPKTRSSTILHFDKRVIGGYDGRFNSSSDLDNELISKIKQNNYKMQILKYLENPANSILDKIKILETISSEETQNKISPNIESGGLFNDWNFDF